MELIKISEAAERLGVSRQTMANWGKSGVIRLHKAGRSGAYYVDAATVEAMADTAADIEATKQKLAHEQEELRLQYEEKSRTLDSLRRDVFMLKKFGRGVIDREFYISIPMMLYSLGVLSSRESGIMIRVINGEDTGSIGEDVGLTRERVRLLFLKGCRKARSLENLKSIIDEAKSAQRELEYLRKKEKTDADYIKELEEKLDIMHKPQDEQNRVLMMKRLVDCGFTVRTLNCLKSAGIETVGDLLRVERGSLLKVRNFGKKSITELDSFLESIGKEWGSEYVVPYYPKGRSYPYGYVLSKKPYAVYESDEALRA